MNPPKSKEQLIEKYEIRMRKMVNEKLRLENRCLRMDQQILKLKKENALLQESQVKSFVERIHKLRP